MIGRRAQGHENPAKKIKREVEGSSSVMNRLVNIAEVNCKNT